MNIQLVDAKSKNHPVAGEPFSGVDRRRSTRFDPVEDRVWLGWWDGEQFQTIAARLIDISRTGAALICVDGPEKTMDAWFCVVGPRHSGGARAQVVGREPMPGQPEQYRLRLTFHAACPEDVYLVALGILPALPGLDSGEKQPRIGS